MAADNAQVLTDAMELMQGLPNQVAAQALTEMQNQIVLNQRIVDDTATLLNQIIATSTINQYSIMYFKLCLNKNEVK